MEISTPPDFIPDNEQSLAELIWAITSSQGEFALILARCNSLVLQQKLTAKLQVDLNLHLQEITIESQTKKLYQSIAKKIANSHPGAVLISGLENVYALKSLLATANCVREEFRKNFRFPLVVWVTDDVLSNLVKFAADLQSWATTIEFTLSTNELIELILNTANDVFNKVLDVGSGRFIDNQALNLQVGSYRRQELEYAWQELQKRCVKLNPEVEACLEFVLGRDSDISLETAYKHYQHSLVLWQQQAETEREIWENNHHIYTYLPPKSELLIRQGCLLYCLGLWWRTYGVFNRAEYERACINAKYHFQQAIGVFEQAGREDLVAKFMNALGGVLQRLEDWEELQEVAERGLILHQKYADPLKLARAYGFLAEVAIASANFSEAEQQANQALDILKQAKVDFENTFYPEQEADLEWELSYHQGWYLYALGRALFSQGNIPGAIEIFLTACAETKPQYDPRLYIAILGHLRDVYFYQKNYLLAFHTKQHQRSIQQQYGFRAFIGAGRLEALQQITNPGLVLTAHRVNVAPEIMASGRGRDVDNLCKRIARHDQKLTIIHGPSGVGKSSILQAGLVPALQKKSINTRNIVPILQQVYTGWVQELNRQWYQGLMSSGNFQCDVESNIENSENTAPTDLLPKDNLAIQSVLDYLHFCVDNNLIVVLIFDQLEEFFVIHPEQRSRRYFYQFLRSCLEIPHVKIILSLREDYLHYLLECNNRLLNFDIINNNILDAKNLYYLGNFSKRYASSFLVNINKKTQLNLEINLIKALLQDLAREVGEIRPIELQIVGYQLETEGINSLEQYKQFGTKEKLVEKFLEEVIHDCGQENKQAARLVLYFLTEENNIRPLKTIVELSKELESADYGEVIPKLSLIMEILLGSNLILKIPQDPADSYQLVHDYLIGFIRTSQQAREVQQRKQETAKRLHTEEKLNRSLKLQRNWAIATMIFVIICAIAIFGLWLEAQLYYHNQVHSSRGFGVDVTNTHIEPYIQQFRH